MGSQVVRKKYKPSALDGTTLNVERYECAGDVVELAATREVTDSRFHDYRKDGLDESPSWCGGIKSLDEACELLKTGYQPNVDKIMSGIKANLSGQKKRYRFDQSVAGFAPIVPLALMGVPNSMISIVQEPIKTKVIDIYYDMTANCSVSSNSILKAGATMISTLLELEMRGYRFNLYAIQSYSESDSADVMIVKVKNSNLALDVKRMSFPLTHTAFFRVIGFDWYSRVPDGKYRYGYGHELTRDHLSEDVTTAFKQMFGQNSVYFSGAKIIDKDKSYIESVILNSKNDSEKKGR